MIRLRGWRWSVPLAALALGMAPYAAIAQSTPSASSTHELTSSPGPVSASTAAPPGAAGSPPAKRLIWVRTHGDHLIDASGHTVVLRGFVFTPNPRRGISYGSADYSRLRSWGGNYQSIKVMAGAAGYGGLPAKGYLDGLSQMVQLAEQQGIYTDLKMTVYDVPRFDWTSFWKDKNGEQDKYLQTWQGLWQRFGGDPGVVGYDLLNEPEMGQLGLSEQEFQSRYLTPFYEKAIAELRATDTRHIAFFQPEFEPHQGGVPYYQPPHLSQTAYAPHFYPKHPDFSTAN